MLNELITWVLNTYLGKYLEDFNPAQLSIGLISGEVELENVPIRKDALRSFGIPVEAVSGTIGKIKLQIPVRQFRTSPWCIVIERVYAVFAPKNLNEWDHKREKEYEYRNKLNILDSKEAAWRLENDCNVESYYSLSYSSWLNYGATLATNILENLELKIIDVHLRYEDTLTVPSSPFSAGVRIQSISAQTCDVSWIPGTKNNNSNNISYKLLELKNLCLYWDKLYEANKCYTLSSKDLLTKMNDICKKENHTLVINPINATAKFKRERCKKAIRSKNRPRVCCDVVLPEVKVVLNEVQYSEIIKCISNLQSIEQIRSQKICRPNCDVETNPKIWWKHASKCYGFNFRSSEEKWEVVKKNIRYIQIYKRLLINPSENLSKEDREFKIEMEKVTNMDELKFLRDVSCRNVSLKGLNLRNTNQNKNILFHWFPSWFGWYGTNSSANDEFYEKIEDDILNAIKETIENDSFSNRDVIFANFTFSLSNGRILLTCGQNPDDIALEMEFHNLILFTEIKPKFSSYRIGVSLGVVSLQDKLTDMTEFPYIIKPQIQGHQELNNFMEILNKNGATDGKEAWFQLQYEKNPFEHQSDYRLTINSKSVDVVYNENCFKWLLNFFTKPVSDLKKDFFFISKNKRSESRLKFLNNWKSVLMGKKDYRKKWSFEINISAPRIIYVESFWDKNTTVFVIDFGRFQLFKNERDNKCFNLLKENVDDESEDELFMTPCSTPPGSQISPSSVLQATTTEIPFLCQETSTISKIVINKDTGLENNLLSEMYDKYVINLTEMQVIICKNRECSFACSKTSSSFHLLDKFNISIELERRIINTSDPEYPAITLFGNLQKIVAHVNEQKITECLQILNRISLDVYKQIISSELYPHNLSYDVIASDNKNDVIGSSNIIIFQFVIEQMILEIQSQEKSIAELQVIGTKAGISKQNGEININMCVHGFLLVDAIQSFGHDFELLIASHRNVEMDSVSGTLKQSQPCSPISPGSPDPNVCQRPTSPNIINKVVSDLELGKTYNYNAEDALIMVDITIIEPPGDAEPIQMANITFNNLDVIANQETIVELIGIAKRIIDSYKRFHSSHIKISKKEKLVGPKEKITVDHVKAEINFNFHRLNILVLRRSKIEEENFGRKVGTLTMSEAKIHAELGKDITVAGALGGIQIMDVTSEGLKHQRIFSVGVDPSTDLSNPIREDVLYPLTNEMYGICEDDFQTRNALSFKIIQTQNFKIVIKMRMASVWYTHCPRFIEEIYLCVKEFKQYFTNFVKSLRNKATHMANSLVHHIGSVRKKNYNKFGHISLDVILSTPVLILPRTCKSMEILVANLGEINISNSYESSENDQEILTRDTYFIDIRNVNLYSLNNDDGNELRSKLLPKAKEFYTCQNKAAAILYDTALLFQCKYETKSPGENTVCNMSQTFSIKGSVTESFNICLSRSQYVQLKDTVYYATDIKLFRETISNEEDQLEIQEEISSKISGTNSIGKICLEFSVPILKLDLRNEHNTSLINITFQEFSYCSSDFAKRREVQVFLRSVIMEDLKCSINSKYRNMVDSSTDIDDNKHILRNNMSSSCPNILDLKRNGTLNHSLSIPSNLNKNTVINLKNENFCTKLLRKVDLEMNQKLKTKNLVMYKSTITKYDETNKPDKIKSSIDFNSLNLIISTEKWFMVFDFFGLITNPTEMLIDQSKHAESNIRTGFKMELEVSIRSLNLILVKNESELSKANISCVLLHISKTKEIESIDGRLGSVSLSDLTPYGCLYKERFSTSGTEALNFTYKRCNFLEGYQCSRSLEKDADLVIFMSSVKYVHTKRFIVELHLFMQELLQLQTPVMRHLKKIETRRLLSRSNMKIGLEIHAESPIILLPVSYKSNHLLIADLGKFRLVNNFCHARDVKSVNEKHSPVAVTHNEIVDVMKIDLVNINFLTGERENNQGRVTMNKNFNVLHVGNFSIVKLGNAIFKEKCRLKLQVIRNTASGISHKIPDVTVEGTLSELHGLINLQQYKLIRGFFNYNLGETIDDVYYYFQANLNESIEKLCSLTKVNVMQHNESVWNILSMKFLLENVIITLAESVELKNRSLTSALACIKFIKSTLEIDSFSDGSQDIDLISSEILIMDAREQYPSPNSHNVFKYILKPKVDSSFKNLVQAEVHSRRRNYSSKYTILLNNMRIMAILDYLEKLNNFLNEDFAMPLLEVAKNPNHHKIITPQEKFKTYACLDNQPKYEFVLNITNSEVVFVENNEQIDTNAIILKSTTVYSYKPNNTIVPISINVNHLEIFSCILESENESSQSIIDPFSLNMELRDNCFQVHIQNKIFLRISYHDAMLFYRIMQSIPKQTNKHVLRNCIYRNDFEKISPLIAMGFKHSECWLAMELNSFNINEAAIWLSQQKYKNSSPALNVNNIAVNATSLSVCIIDDCLDADVPLLELSFSNLKFTQKIQIKEEKSIIFYEGEIDTAIASDYYNRRLSGWEPIIEPWNCVALWKYSKCTIAKTKSLSIQACSKQLLKLNITSTFIELCDLVHKNWTEDYLQRFSYKNDVTRGSGAIRKRLPFVPFALKNLTGAPLIFKIFYSQAGGITRTEVTQHDLLCNWISAQHNEIVPFDFGPQSKLRHLDSHKLNMHQILVQIHGWTLIGPISIDKVGTFFHYATQDMQYSKKTRIVFEVSLMGSAQKLIVVRSALNVINKTMKTFSLRLKLINEAGLVPMTINPFEKLTIPLHFIDAYIYLKPLSVVESTNCEGNDFCKQPIHWTDCVEIDCYKNIHSCFISKQIPIHVLVEIKKDKYPMREIMSMPGHTITIMPPLKLKNLLCCDLLFKITGHAQGRLNASEEVEIYSIDIHESFCLSITLDNYKLSGCLKIPMGHIGIVEPKLKLVDVLNRELFLRISIQSFQGKGMEILIGAPIWIINKTGLPLIFKQEGTNLIASGQFDEHEYAREVSPLMFSFSDQEGPPLIEFRLGKSFGIHNKFCKSFGIHRETREVIAEQSKAAYVIGVNVQRGTGLYSFTTFITLTPRFQLYNKSKYILEFVQKCDIKVMEITSANKVINALPGSSFPFHWSSCEQEPLLCVRIVDKVRSHWSCGLPVNEAKSVYINVRNELGEMIFLRVEVVLHGGMFILHFTDAYNLPPPIRIDNYSEVPIYFSQKDVVPHWRTNVKPLSSLAYVLDDPLGSQTLLLEAPGGNSIEYSISKNKPAKSITYANFIYICFKETFQVILVDSESKNVGITGQQLVLGVKDKRVVITKKCTGDRSQLWLMNSSGQLEHEGSSPPTEYFKPTQVTPRLVLDVEKPPNPYGYTRLVIRPQNKQRSTTQTWRFENGRLMCHANMCVQAANGVYGLKPNCDAVLGKMETNTKAFNKDNIPFEQSIEIQKLRPGSGQLEVINKMDGPIKCMQIRDVKNNSEQIALAQDALWDHTSVFNKVIHDKTEMAILNELMVQLMLSKGLGISIVARKPCEELAYISLEDIVFNIMLSPSAKAIDLKVGDMQIDNQLLDSQYPVVLHTWKSNTENGNREALIFKTKLLQSPNKNAVIFEYFTLEVKPCTVIFEERFILKTALFMDFEKHRSQEELEAGNHFYRNNEYQFSKNTKRFYFEECSLGATQVRLSVLTASKLSPELLEIKKGLGLTLIKFEDAAIEFDKFSDRHHFETLEVYVKAIKSHYVNQLKWHAASILGSVDFLGNPLGFANDLSEGVSGLIFEGSVTSLVKNITHGLSNSTAKLTETLSDSLGRVVLDDHDNETRQKILEVAHPTSGGGHLAAGIKGFGFGLLGGVTSIVRNTYIGAQSDGLPGFFSGLGKGIVGTVTKPLIGVLDLASETASAVRETSRGSHHFLPDRKRLPRCVTGAPGGLLPFYSYRQSKGQQYLYIINRRNFTEKLIFYEPNLCNDEEAQLRLLVSTEYIRIFSMYEEEPAIMFECHLSEVLSCHPLASNATTTNKMLPNFYIEISTNVPKVTRPRVKCQNEEISERASRCINYAKAVFDEREHSVTNS